MLKKLTHEIDLITKKKHIVRSYTNDTFKSLCVILFGKNFYMNLLNKYMCNNAKESNNIIYS